MRVQILLLFNKRLKIPSPMGFESQGTRIAFHLWLERSLCPGSMQESWF